MPESTQLPVGRHPPALDLPHFPTRHQAVVWRNWQLVPTETLADLLGTNVESILSCARDLGLPVPPVVNLHYRRRGYATLIRNNWHLLPYEQLLTLLGWSAERLAFILREDDFLWHKLGDLKPRCEAVAYRPLTADEARRTVDIRRLVAQHFTDLDCLPGEPQFAFVDSYARPTGRPAPAPGNSRFDLRMIYPYFALYGDPLLEPDLDPFPEGLLERLAGIGINAVWMQGILYSLVPWLPDASLSRGWERRIESLRTITERAERYGVSLLLYLNEPRALPRSFHAKHPDYAGVADESGQLVALCTSRRHVVEGLREAVQRLFRSVPTLGGVFTITMSENLTNCHSRFTPETCPRCSQRPAAEVVAEVNTAIAEGAHVVKPDARVIVWTWGWQQDWAHEAVDRLPAGVEVMCSSERFLPTQVGGVEGWVEDYSISQVGPSAESKAIWDHARRRGLKAVAKVQLNTTWECSAIPYIPAVDLVQEHLSNLAECGVTGIMASWTLGGYPGGNLGLLGASAAELAESRFGAAAAPLVRRARTQFSEAFREFPFHVGVAYLGPQNAGPANPLYLKPTGFPATMVGFPYDDVNAWRSIYPADVFENQLRLLGELWRRGLDTLEEAGGSIDDAHRNEFRDLLHAAWGCYCHFRSSYLQVAFIRKRDSNDPDRRERMLEIVAEEIEVAKTAYRLARQDARIGFEATNHYAYSLNDLKEKVVQCEYVRDRLAQDGGF